MSNFEYTVYLSHRSGSVNPTSAFYKTKASYTMLPLVIKVNVITHHTQETTDFIDGSYAAEEAHGH